MMALRPFDPLSARLPTLSRRAASGGPIPACAIPACAMPAAPIFGRSMMAASMLAVALGLAASGPARADAGLALSQGDIFSDAVGSVIGVSITNNGTAPLGSAVVTCTFTAGGRPAGSAATNLYNILPGQKGQDQVHMMGVKADKATCSITSTTPAAN